MNLYSWVFGGYMLASTITIPLFARLADIFGRRMLYVAGLSIFLAGSALISTAQSMDVLVGYRVWGSAPVQLPRARLHRRFVRRRRAWTHVRHHWVQCWRPDRPRWVAGLQIHFWRWGFYLVLPVGALALVLAWFRLANKSQWKSWQTLRLDWQGALLIGLGLCLGLLGFQALGAGNVAYGALSCAVAILTLGFAAHWEQKQADPVIPIPLLKVPSMWKPVVGTLLLGLATNGAIAYFPLYLQKIYAQTATATGLALLPMLLMAGIASGVGGSLASRYPRQTQSTAWILVSLGFSLLAVFHTENILLIAALIGAGLGLLLPVYLHAAQQAGGEVYLATASGLIQMARNMGGALGIPLLGAWLALGETNITAFIAMFVSLAIIGALGFSLEFVSPKPTHNAPHPALLK
jgi:MFS family permease